MKGCYHLIRDQLVLVVPRSHRAADPGPAVPHGLDLARDAYAVARTASCAGPRWR